MIATFNLKKQIILKIDTSDYVIEMYISQSDNKERLKLIVFYSRKMILTKSNYKIHNKKFLIIVITFNK